MKKSRDKSNFKLNLCQQKKVLEITHSLNAGGIETFLVNFLKARTEEEKKRFSIDFWTLSTDREQYYEKEINEEGCRIFRQRAAGCTNFAHKILCFFYLPYLLIKFGPYDIVHIHLHSTGALFAPLLKLFGVKKIILHSHNTRETAPSALWRAVYPRLSAWLAGHFADRLCACSEEAGRELFGSNKVTVIKNGIDTEKFSFRPWKRTEKRKELGLSNYFVIGNIGRLMPQKNHSFLLDIFKKIHDLRPLSKLIIAGDGPLKDELKKKAADSGISETIIFLGVRKDTAELYQAMDCFILPSLFEGLGIVCIEAQCCGLPCFVSDKVPELARVCNTVALPLSAPPEEWAEKTIARTDINKRKDCSKIMKDKGFDNRTTAEQIFSVYDS